MVITASGSVVTSALMTGINDIRPTVRSYDRTIIVYGFCIGDFAGLLILYSVFISKSYNELAKTYNSDANWAAMGVDFPEHCPVRIGIFYRLKVQQESINGL